MYDPLRKVLRSTLHTHTLAIVITATLTLAVPCPARAQAAPATEGCFAPAQSRSGPAVSLTLWCQIVEYSGAAPLSAGWDTGLVTLAQGFSATVLHVQYDDWYSAMDSVVQLEIVRSSSDIVLAPVVIHYAGVAWTADIPVSVSASAGDRFRITQQSGIAHPCGLVDNCGLHMTLTLE